MENLKEKIEELLNTKITKTTVVKSNNSKENEYEISITFNGNLIEMKSLFDITAYNDELKKIGKEPLNLHYEKYGKCKKGISYNEKVKMFEDNVSAMLIGSIFIGQITKEDFSDIYELLRNDNILIPYLPIFRYKDRVMCMATSEAHDDFEHGKYAIYSLADK